LIKIEPIEYYTHYQFVPSPDGGFYGIGFGILLNGLNETINTLINQLLDAGTLSNAGGGWVGSGVTIGRKKSGEIPFRIGQWTQVSVSGGTLRDNFFPRPDIGPSPTLFQLLGM